MTTQADRQSRPLKLCLFDDRRGQVEGEEADKVLAFYPSSTPLNKRTAAVGFTQAILAFTSVFDKVPCESIQADRQTWALQSCEPHVWLLLVADRAQLHAATTDHSALAAVLQHLRNLLHLLVGRVELLLQQDEKGEAARRQLQPLVSNFGDRLCGGKTLLSSPLQNVLSSHCTHLPQLPLPLLIQTGAQALVHRALVFPLEGAGSSGGTSSGALLLQGQWALCAALPPGDAAALYCLASLALLPARVPSLRKRIASAAGRRPRAHATGQSSLLDPQAWVRTPSGFLIPRTAAESASAPADVIPEDHGPVQLATVWQQEAPEAASLLAFCQGDAMLLLLAPEGYSPDHAALAGLAAALGGGLRDVSRAAGEHLAAVKYGHITGFRYAADDALAHSTCASPASKTSTLSHDSLALTTAIRGWAEDLMQEGGSASVEVIARAQPHCWGVAKRTGGSQLLLPLENQKGDSLLETSVTAEAFADQNWPGVFL